MIYYQHRLCQFSPILKIMVMEHVNVKILRLWNIIIIAWKKVLYMKVHHSGQNWI